MRPAQLTVAAVYFGLIGYTIGKKEIDKKVAKGIRQAYTGLARYTAVTMTDAVRPQPLELVFHGTGCPGHTTGMPAETCLYAGKT
jgi:hypothetical protein